MIYETGDWIIFTSFIMMGAGFTYIFGYSDALGFMISEIISMLLMISWVVVRNINGDSK